MRSADLPGRWVERAACGGRLDLEPLFFPEKGVPAAIAKAMCGQCPVRVQCLDFALATHQEFGIWGGMSARERRRIRRIRRRATAA
jgi:WhiB family redox-sensing transcriptional regulator